MEPEGWEELPKDKPKRNAAEAELVRLLLIF